MTDSGMPGDAPIFGRAASPDRQLLEEAVRLADQRLARIEQKLDALAEAVAKTASESRGGLSAQRTVAEAQAANLRTDLYGRMAALKRAQLSHTWLAAGAIIGVLILLALIYLAASRSGPPAVVAAPALQPVLIQLPPPATVPPAAPAKPSPAAAAPPRPATPTPHAKPAARRATASTAGHRKKTTF